MEDGRTKRDVTHLIFTSELLYGTEFNQAHLCGLYLLKITAALANRQNSMLFDKSLARSPSASGG